MKAQHLLLIPLAMSAVDAFSALSSSSSSLARRNSGIRSIRMDSESSLDASAMNSISRTLQKSNLHTSQSSIPLQQKHINTTPIHEAQAAHGMPWSDTIGQSDHEEPLLYMPFWEWQIEHMKTSLTNLKCDDDTLDANPSFAFNSNPDKKARIVSQCYTSDEYRKIRMTYYDAGDNTQVFNSVWYPDPKYNLPILGIDLLAFNRKKFLAIVDFQPLYEDETDHATTFEHRLSPIKNQYESLNGKMSSKFYDETQFFSQQMLFARFEDSSVVTDDLFPAFQRYVKMHNKLIKETEPDALTSNISKVMDRQTAYDTYSAERDPATGLFASMFGKEWADDYVFDFLFSLSEKKEGGVVIPPMFGGGGPPGGGKPSGGGNPFAPGGAKDDKAPASTNGR